MEEWKRKTALQRPLPVLCVQATPSFSFVLFFLIDSNVSSEQQTHIFLKQFNYVDVVLQVL